MPDVEITPLGKYVMCLTDHMKSANAEIDKWQAKVRKSGLEFALSSADGMFEVVSQLDVDKQVLLALTQHGRSLEDIKKYATDQAVQGARTPGQSTSVTSTLMRLMRTKAWAQIVEDFAWGEYK